MDANRHLPGLASDLGGVLDLFPVFASLSCPLCCSIGSYKEASRGDVNSVQFVEYHVL